MPSYLGCRAFLRLKVKIYSVSQGRSSKFVPLVNSILPEIYLSLKHDKTPSSSKPHPQSQTTTANPSVSPNSALLPCSSSQ